MTEPLDAEELGHLEQAAALGYLLGAMSHELNNHLTNILLGADQVGAEDTSPAHQLMLRQAEKAASVVAVLQGMASANLSRGGDVVDLVDLCVRLKAWLLLTMGEDIGEIRVGDDEIVVLAGRQNLLRALCNLSRVGAGAGAAPLIVSVGIEQVPRSLWAPAGEEVSMAVVRLRRGSPPTDVSPWFKELVDGFFTVDRSLDEIALMAAWEVVRKLRGRLEMYGGAGASGQEVVIKLPLGRTVT